MSQRMLLSTCIIASRMLRKRTVGQKNVGVLLPASVGGVIANMSLLMLGKTVVNLNYTTGPDTLPGDSRAGAYRDHRDIRGVSRQTPGQEDRPGRNSAGP